MIKKNYGFYEAFDVSDETDNKRQQSLDNKCDEYNPRTVNDINTKNEMLEYLKIMEYKLIDMFPTPTFIRKINNGNYNGYVNKKLNKELDTGDARRAEATCDSFKFKRLEKIKTKEPLESNEESLESDEQKIVELSDMPPLEGDEEEI